MKTWLAILFCFLLLSIILACSISSIPTVLTTLQPTKIDTPTQFGGELTAQRPVQLTPSGVISTQPSVSIYIVQSGDKLVDIARLFRVTIEEILELNGLAEGSEVPAGYQLLIPVPATYQATAPAGVCDQATFITDVTIPDGMKMDPGESFTKTWRVKNTGYCTWTSEYSLVYFAENQMEGADRYPLTTSVMPGADVDISVVLTAPLTPGKHRGIWRLLNHQNMLFDLPLFVSIEVEGSAQAGAIAETSAAGESGSQPTPTFEGVVSAPQSTSAPLRVNPNLEFTYQPYSLAALASGTEMEWTKQTYTRLHIINNSTRDLCKVYIYPSENSYLGTNYLKEPLASYQQTILILPEGSYNLQVEACTAGGAWGQGLFGMTVASQEDSQLGNIDPVWIIGDDDTNLRIYPRKLFNRSGEVRFQVIPTWGEICIIQMWPSFRDWQQGDPLFYDRENPINNKQNYIFEITPGIYNIAAWNCQGEFLANEKNVYVFTDNTWKVELGVSNLDYDPGLLEDISQCGWICEGYNSSELTTYLDAAVDTIGVGLPVNATHADVIPLCFISRYFTSTQTDVGWKCGWMPTVDGYEFTLQRLYGDQVDALFETQKDAAEIDARVLLLDKRYFEVLEVQPFKVYDDGQQFIQIPRYPDSQVLFTVNVYETDKAAKFAYRISEIQDGYLVDVDQGNPGSYVQGAIIVIRQKEKISEILRGFHIYTKVEYENVTKTCTSVTTKCHCENNRVLALCFFEISTYWPAGDEDFAIGYCSTSWCPLSVLGMGNENSYADIYRTILSVK